MWWLVRVGLWLLLTYNEVVGGVAVAAVVATAGDGVEGKGQQGVLGP
jgi:hypothetical protein